MLSTADDFANSLSSLAPSKDALTGITNFVTAVATFTNQVQASSSGTAGILTFGNSAMITAMMSMVPVKDNSWIENFANAWTAGITASIIAPGTVTDSIWVGSGSKDTETLPSASATITTIPAATAILISYLSYVVPTSGPPIPMATALRNATLALSFNCIGLGPPPPLTPIPVLLAAQ